MVSAYKHIYDGKRKQTKQTPMDVFLKRVTSPQEPQPGPSGGTPEERTVITGDDSSVQVLALEDLPVENL